MQIYILMGPPGVGKGTNAVLLCEALGFEQYSTGQVFRDEIAAGSDLGAKVKSYMDSGSLVPDEIVVEVAASYLASKKAEGCNGVFLDGFPRTVPQAEALEETLAKLQMPLNGAVQMDADRDLLIVRLCGRRVCKSCGATYHMEYIKPKTEGVCDACGGELYQRADDSLETVTNRLKVYEEQTAPLLDFYKNRKCLGIADITNDTPANLAKIKAAMAACQQG